VLLRDRPIDYRPSKSSIPDPSARPPNRKRLGADLERIATGRLQHASCRGDMAAREPRRLPVDRFAGAWPADAKSLKLVLPVRIELTTSALPIGL
jgi:hypothetical protein